MKCDKLYHIIGLLFTSSLLYSENFDRCLLLRMFHVELGETTQIFDLSHLFIPQE